MDRLKEKVAVITGAGSGIGQYTAVLFAQEGAKVVVADVNEEGGRETVRQVEAAGGEALFVKTDVSKMADCRALVARTVERFGKLDVLFCNAGLIGHTQYDIGHQSEEIFDRFCAVNFKGVWNTIHCAAAELVKSRGSIVNTCSAAATVGNYGCTIYGTTKGAVLTLTLSVANELAPYGVRCNCISPYTALTPGVIKTMNPQKEAIFHEGNPMHRLINVHDIAYTVLFLASDEARCVNGVDIRVDCGANIQGQPIVMETFFENNPYEGKIPYQFDM